MQKSKQYFFCVAVCFAMIVLMLGTATLIVCVPSLAEGFSKFFGAKPMNWEEAKPILITDYILSIPLSFLGGGIIYLTF